MPDARYPTSQICDFGIGTLARGRLWHSADRFLMRCSRTGPQATRREVCGGARPTAWLKPDSAPAAHAPGAPTPVRLEEGEGEGSIERPWLLTQRTACAPSPFGEVSATSC